MTSPVATLRSSTVFCFRRDGDCLAVRPGVDREVLAKELLARDQEARFLRDHAADVIGKSAVRVGDVWPALDHDDLGFFVQPAQTRCTRGSACYSTNDDDFHNSSPNLAAGCDRRYTLDLIVIANSLLLVLPCARLRLAHQNSGS